MLFRPREGIVAPCTYQPVVLGPKDVLAFMDIRRLSLVDSPWAFGSSPEDDRMRDPAAVVASLTADEQVVLGVRDPADPERLLAVGGVMREARLKRRHIASIYGVFTRPEARGRGLARAVTAAAIEAARAWSEPSVEVVQLSVSEPDGEGRRPTAARRLYESLGFVAWGVEPDSMCLPNGRRLDQVHMALRLRG